MSASANARTFTQLCDIKLCTEQPKKERNVSCTLLIVDDVYCSIDDDGDNDHHGNCCLAYLFWFLCFSQAIEIENMVPSLRNAMRANERERESEKEMAMDITIFV